MSEQEQLEDQTSLQSEDENREVIQTRLKTKLIVYVVRIKFIYYFYNAELIFSNLLTNKLNLKFIERSYFLNYDQC